jgi:hypothetical protein
MIRFYIIVAIAALAILVPSGRMTIPVEDIEVLEYRLITHPSDGLVFLKTRFILYDKIGVALIPMSEELATDASVDLNSLLASSILDRLNGG